MNLWGEKAKNEKVIRKRETMSKRNADIVKTLAVGKIIKAETKDGLHHLYYNVHLKHLIKQGDFFYVEEELERRKASFRKKNCMKMWKSWLILR